VSQSPFAQADAREGAWLAYHSGLQRLMDERVFLENFSIGQVYVELRGYWEERKAVVRARGAEADQPPAKHVVDAESDVLEWVRRGDRQDALRIIAGGPGSGKSTLARKLAAVLAGDEGLRVLLIPLQWLDLGSDLPGAVASFIERRELGLGSPLDPKDAPARLLVIFDGLDELTKQGEAGREAAGDLLTLAGKALADRNSVGLRLQILVSGRTLAVQENEVLLRGPRRILNVLPFWLPDDEIGAYQDTEDRLEVDSATSGGGSMARCDGSLWKGCLRSCVMNAWTM
jgi:hypothetical protein